MENHKRGLPVFVKKHIYRQVTDVFLIVYLLKNIINIIKANTIIASTTKANKSKYIISNKTASIIVPPPFSQPWLWSKSGKPHLLVLISYSNIIYLFWQNSNGLCFKIFRQNSTKKVLVFLTNTFFVFN